MKNALVPLALAAILSLGLSHGSARAATFVAEVKGDTVTVYSTSKKKEKCQLANTFSYVVNGERYTTTQKCSVEVEPGNHLEVCHVKHSDINQAKIEKPVEVTACVDRQ